MSHSKIAIALLILGSVMVWSADAPAQAPTPPTPPSAPTSPSPPVAAHPAASPTNAPAAQQATADPIGSVATLQGAAAATHNNAAKPLALRGLIFKGDILQTGVDGTLGITFDDDTTFTLKPNSRIAVDDFVYQEGGTGNAARFNVLRGTVAFVAAEVAHTGNMKIDTPTSTLGIRGTTGLVEVPADATAGAAGGVSIKLYPDADGRVGRIEVFGRDGSQLGVLNRGATGFAVRAGAARAAQRFTAVPLQISAQEAERDRSFVRQVFSTQLVGRQINVRRRNLQRNNPQRPNQLQPNNLQRPGQPGRQQLPGLQPRPGQPPGPRPELQRQPGAAPGLPRAPNGQRKPGKKQENR
jgi:FecR protein